MDAECSYDPYQLGSMLPLLKDGVDVVTGSPYHPAGQVKNVRWWRQALPRLRELLYRMAFRHRLRTYTSVFRVYRRSAVVEMQVLADGAVGVTEMLGRLEQAGARIVECPVVLEPREGGASTREKLRTAVGHLGLMLRLTGQRLWG
jgi:dolichol-phosphate mannosyltransferase